MWHPGAISPKSTFWRKQDFVLPVIKENWRSGSAKDSLQIQCVHGKQSEVKRTKSSCQAPSISSDWTIPSQADARSHTSTNWQLLIIGNPNYRGLQCLLKLLIITANNYSVPDLPLEGGWNNYTPSQSMTTPYSHSESQPGSLTVRQAQSETFTSARPTQTVDGNVCRLSRNLDSLDQTFHSWREPQTMVQLLLRRGLRRSLQLL